MSGWLDAPAGKHGRVTRRGGDLFYNGQKQKFWGINLTYMHTAPDNGLAEKRANLYARYGVNAVRLHKFADGNGWRGILSSKSATQYDPDKLDNIDYFVYQLKQKGIYTKLSAVFGGVPVGPDDSNRIDFFDDLKKKSDGWRGAPQGALWFSEGLQQILIDQMVNVLDHKNPYTGMRP